METTKEKDMILHDGMLKTCLKLSLSAVIAMLLYGLNTVFDAVFVGNLVGEEALAGVSIVYPLTQIALGLGSLVVAFVLILPMWLTSIAAPEFVLHLMSPTGEFGGANLNYFRIIIQYFRCFALYLLQ